MRLTEFEIQSIVDTVNAFVPSGEVRLFGSRTDDEKRGGDIDLLLLAPEPIAPELQDKIMLRLYDLIGEQKIDLLVEQADRLSTFGQLALRRSIALRSVPNLHE